MLSPKSSEATRVLLAPAETLLVDGVRDLALFFRVFHVYIMECFCLLLPFGLWLISPEWLCRGFHFDDCFLFLGKRDLRKEFSALLPRIMLAHATDAHFSRWCCMISPSSVTVRSTRCFSCLSWFNTHQGLNSFFSATFRAIWSFPGELPALHCHLGLL